MKMINPPKMGKQQLDRLGVEAEKVTFENTRPLTKDARLALARAARKGGRPRIGAGAKRINICRSYDDKELVINYFPISF